MILDSANRKYTDIVRKALVTTKGFGKILVPLSFFPHPKLEKLVSPPFVSKILENFFRAILSNFDLIYRNYCKNIHTLFKRDIHNKCPKML